MIEIVDPGPFAVVQDLGRSGYATLGVPRSGAFDRAALTAGNRLVGNAADAAGIEAVLGGLHVRALDAVTVAVTGAPCPVGATGVTAGWGAAVSLPAGALLHLGAPSSGLRCYLAVRGGVESDEVLGSCSTDTMGGLGRPSLGAGERLVVGDDVASLPSGDFLRPTTGGPLPVRFGPRDDWFADPTALLMRSWTVRADSDRVGVRLDGPALERVRRDELPSEATVPGAVQVPGDGRPIVFGPDSPTTGGYPVIAVVTDLDRVAQVRPGDTVRFVRH